MESWVKSTNSHLRLVQVAAFCKQTRYTALNFKEHPTSEVEYAVVQLGSLNKQFD